MNPTVGRIVHFYWGDTPDPDASPHAAIVVGDSGLAGLTLVVFDLDDDAATVKYFVAEPRTPEAARNGCCWVWPPKA